MEVVTLTPVELVAYAMTSLGGLLINFLNKAATENLTWNDYWASKPLNTIASLFITSGLFISLALSGETNHLTYISVSFMADALVNRSYPGGGATHGEIKDAKRRRKERAEKSEEA